MKGNTVLAWMWCVIATWVLFGSTTSACSLTSNLKDFPKLTFNAGEADESSYGDLIAKLRVLIANPGDSRHGIPVLYESVEIEQMFVLVELTSWSEYSITLAVNVTNSYILGYLADNTFFYFPPENEIQREQISHLFPDAVNRVELTTLGVRYGDLARVAGEGRRQIALGLEPLNTAIDRLYERSLGRTPDSSLARSFIVILQMISEAARFHVIEGAMRVRIQTNNPEPPHENMVSLENEWSTISTAAQNSNQGAFSDGVQVVNEEGDYITVYDVASLIPFIALLLFQCNSPSSSSSSQFPLLIRNIVPNDDDVCLDPEPTVRIVGINGLCLQVYEGDYHDGNGMRMLPCKTNADVDQLWTLKTDYTIRSNGKCLTTYGYSPGSYIMIYDCDSAVSDATRWRIAIDGTIINPKSLLVLTAKEDSKGVRVFLEEENFGTHQSWRPTNNTQIFMGEIVGFKALCLANAGSSLYLEKCDPQLDHHIWARYVDGTIRPKQNQSKCLATDEALIIKPVPCTPGSTVQRWVFMNDRTFRNLIYGMVLTVQDSNPLKPIIMSAYDGGENQKWFPML